MSKSLSCAFSPFTMSLSPFLETAKKGECCPFGLFAAFGLLCFKNKNPLSPFPHTGDHSLLVKWNHLFSELGWAMGVVVEEGAGGPLRKKAIDSATRAEED